MTQLVRTGYLLSTSSRRVLFNSASFALDFTTGFYKNAAGYVRTNLAVQSRNLASGSWQTYWAGPTSRTANAAVAPDGTNTATRIVLPVNPGSQPPGIVQVVPIATGVTSTVSVWLRGEVGGEQVLLFNDDNGNGITVTLTTSWQRYWSTGVVGASGGRIGIRNNSTLTAQTIYAWEAQAEPTGYPTSNIPTTTAAASVTTYSSTNPADIGNMTFTRASTGYAEDAQGNLVLFGSNVPRITSKGVLIEPAATQLATSPTNPMGAGWGDVGSTSASLGASSDGAFTMTSVASNGQTWHRRSSGNIAWTAGTSYTISAWYRAGTSGKVQIEVRDVPNTNSSVVAGPVASPSVVIQGAGTITNVTTTAFPNGRYRTSFVFTPSGTGTGGGPGVGPYSTIAGETVIFEGVQVEVGSAPTSLIVAGTRAADVFYYSGASVTSSFTLAATIDHAFANNGSGFYPAVSIGGSYNNVAAIYRRDASSNYQGLIRSSAAAAADMIAGGAPTTGVHHLALRVNDNQFALAKDGAIISMDTVGTSPALNGDRLAIGTESWSPGSQGVAGYIPRIALFPYAANDAQLQSLSSGNFLL